MKLALMQLPATLHRWAQFAATHVLLAVYCLAVTAVVIPLGHVVLDYWRPVVVSFVAHTSGILPASIAAPSVRRGKL